MIFVRDFFMISRELYEKKSVICPSKCTTNVKTKMLIYHSKANSHAKVSFGKVTRLFRTTNQGNAGKDFVWE